jgi:hypothetical protein
LVSRLNEGIACGIAWLNAFLENALKLSQTEDDQEGNALQSDRINETKELPMDLIFSDLQNHQAQECIVQRAEQKVLIGQGLNLPTVVLSQSVSWAIGDRIGRRSHKTQSDGG